MGASRSDSGKTVLITGASRGIGCGIARSFAARGWTLILTCSSSATRDQLEEVSAGLRERYGVRISTFAGDIADETEVERLFDLVRRESGSLDVLVNNAGIDRVGLLQELSFSDWQRILAVNLGGPFLTCRAAIPLMLAAGSGSILNISSVYGLTGAACEAAYAVTKGGLNALTKSLAKELGRSGIRVNAVCPGAVDTEMNDVLTPEDRAFLLEEIPAGRFGTPEEVGELAYDIAVSHPYLTGQLIGLDGGWV